MIREMLKYHVQRFDDPRTKLTQARAFLDFLARSTVFPDTAYARMLHVEHELVQRADDSYVFHEHLEEDNAPVYFHEFHDRLRAHGLQYLSEATFYASEANLPPETLGMLRQLAHDPMEGEQYLDFLCNRTFRRSLICRESVAINRDPGPELLDGLYLTTRVEPESLAEEDWLSDSVVTFRSADRDAHLATNRPLVKIALGLLFRRRPWSPTVDELWEQIRPLLERSGEEGLAREGRSLPLAAVMLRCALSNVVELSVAPLRCVTEARERPVASPLARRMAGSPTPVVNLRHRMVFTDEFQDLLLPLLDGTRDRPALLEVLVQRSRDDDFTIYQGEEPVRDPEALRTALGAMLDPALDYFARNALLIG